MVSFHSSVLPPDNFLFDDVYKKCKLLLPLEVILDLEREDSDDKTLSVHLTIPRNQIRTFYQSTSLIWSANHEIGIFSKCFFVVFR